MAISILHEILAHVDFLARGPGTGGSVPAHERQTNDILVQIEKNMGYRFTVGKIQDELLQALRARELWPEERFSILIHNGSSELRLDRESNMSIEKHLNMLRLDNAMKSTPRRERLRSANSSSVKQQRRRPSAAFSGPLPKSCKNVAPPKIKKRSTMSKPRTPKPNRTARKGATTKDRYPTPGIEIDETPCQSPVPECSTIDLKLPVSESDTQLAVRPTSVPGDTEISPKSIYQTSQSSVEIAFSPMVLFETNHLVISELVYYKERCRKAEDRCAILKNQIRQIRSLENTPQDMAKTLDQNVQQIYSLKRKLGDRTRFEQYLSLSNVRNAAPDSQCVFTEQFRVLNDLLDQIVVLDGTEKPPIGDLKGHSADLDSLLTTVFGKDILSTPEAMPIAFPALNSYNLVRTLTGAAIHSWILGSEYPTNMIGATPLLQEYRSLLDTLCGHDSLCDLDLAVHRSMIKDESFQDVIIPKLSEMFTGRLTSALEPLLPAESKPEGIRKLRSSLRDLSLLSVQIRSELLVGNDHYELVWPSIGSYFDATEMKAKVSGPIAIANAVRLPLCPGIRAHARERAMVDYRGLRMGKSSTSRPKYVVKALVLR